MNIAISFVYLLHYVSCAFLIALNSAKEDTRFVFYLALLDVILLMLFFSIPKLQKLPNYIILVFVYSGMFFYEQWGRSLPLFDSFSTLKTVLAIIVLIAWPLWPSDRKISSRRVAKIIKIFFTLILIGSAIFVYILLATYWVLITLAVVLILLTFAARLPHVQRLGPALLPYVALAGLLNVFLLQEMIRDDFLAPSDTVAERTLILKTPWLYQLSGTSSDGVFFSQPVKDRIGYYDMRNSKTAFISLPTSQDQDSYKSLLLMQSKQKHFVFIGAIFDKRRNSFYRINIEPLIKNKIGFEDGEEISSKLDPPVTFKYLQFPAPVMMHRANQTAFYIVDEETNIFAKIDINGTILAEIKLPYNAPTEFAVDAAGKSAYLRFAYSNQLIKISPPFKTLSRQQSLDAGFFGFLGGGGIVLLSNEILVSTLADNSLWILDLPQLQLRRKIKLTYGPRILRSINQGKHYAVLGYYSGVVQFFRAKSHKLVHERKLARGLHDIWETPDGDLMLTSKKGLHYISKKQLPF